MRIKDVKRKKKKSIVTTVRVTPSKMAFIKKHKINSSRLFNLSLEKLMKVGNK